MNRQTYLALPHVSQFTDWLAAELDSESRFTHEYVDRRTGAQWSCNSLFDAFTHYCWNHPGNSRLAFNPGNCSTSNGLALAALRKDLGNINSNDSRALDAAIDVMSWGGVSAGNASWLKANQEGLAGLLEAVQAAMDAGDELAPVLRSKHLRFNSGMTKVYSLLIDDFIIYDSRVAAALAWLVHRWWVVDLRKSVNGLPPLLRFGCLPGNGKMAPFRNPDKAVFTTLRSNPAEHYMWNVRANWLLGAAFAKANRPVNFPDLRSVEAALFQMGLKV